jgi:ActD protein
VAPVMLVAGIIGGLSAYFMQWYATRDYWLNIGGRPVYSWPAFIPVTFELTVLSAALAGAACMICLAGLPRLDHPVFSDPRFRRASRDRFFICIRADEHGRMASLARESLIKTNPESTGEVFL